ncbi:HVA22-like protein c isoform X2 [Phaseolus vulgaris]|uniref:HVA22-like protein c isoform X2 n=1 Tax=Phaseolus vulgaris TaxID=3885 RepID=UPI0035CB5538
MGASDNNNHFLQVVFNNFDVLALPLVTLAYPLYASIKAIETKSTADDQQWLTYWILYSILTLFELTFAKVLELCWLVLPHFNGAAVVYKNYIRPFYMNPQIPIPQGSQIWYFPQKKSLFSGSDDVLSAAERYMEEHGTEAFERLITKNDRQARTRRTGNYMIFDDDYRY